MADPSHSSPSPPPIRYTNNDLPTTSPEPPINTLLTLPPSPPLTDTYADEEILRFNFFNDDLFEYDAAILVARNRRLNSPKTFSRRFERMMVLPY